MHSEMWHISGAYNAAKNYSVCNVISIMQSKCEQNILCYLLLISRKYTLTGFLGSPFGMWIKTYDKNESLTINSTIRWFYSAVTLPLCCNNSINVPYYGHKCLSRSSLGWPKYACNTCYFNIKEGNGYCAKPGHNSKATGCRLISCFQRYQRYDKCIHVCNWENRRLRIILLCGRKRLGITTVIQRFICVTYTIVKHLDKKKTNDFPMFRLQWRKLNFVQDWWILSMRTNSLKTEPLIPVAGQENMAICLLECQALSITVFIIVMTFIFSNSVYLISIFDNVLVVTLESLFKIAHRKSSYHHDA